MPRHEDTQQSKAQRARQARPKAVDFLSESEGVARVGSSIMRVRKAHANRGNDNDASVGSDGDEEDADTPRVAQWIDEEDLEFHGASESDSEGVGGDVHGASEGGHSRRLRSLEHDLSTLPLGTLRGAQRSLARAQALSNTESDSEAQSEGDSAASDDDDSPPHPGKAKHEELLDQPPKPKHSPIKRSNKHAPVEVTSKRPVGRRRVVVDDELPKPRDPRFVHAAGRYDPAKFKQQYEFLSGLRNDELVTLRAHVKRARKLLANSPAHLRADREEEVRRLEHAMKRAESAVNLDSRERVELKTLQSAKQAEKEKRERGKAKWWMKRSERKELLAKARLDAIASVGGRQAVKKALEKKRRRIGQKEKKMRPLPRSERTEWSDGKKKRPIDSVDSGRGVKRRKV